MNQKIDVSGKWGAHPAQSMAEIMADRIRDARESGYRAGYRIGCADMRRRLVSFAGALLCLGIMLGSIGMVLAMRLSA